MFVPATSDGLSVQTDGERRWAAAAILAIAVAALWPALVNGGPFFMADTPSYVRAAASGFYKLLGIKTAWAEEYLRVYAGSAAPAGAEASPAVSGPAVQIPVTLSGRSIFYGAFVYLSDLAGSLWLVIVAQCLLAGTTIFLTVKAIGRTAGARIGTPAAALIGIIAAIVTPLGYFSGYLMPDIFGGFALLAVANLVFLWTCLSRAERWFWFLLLLYSLLAHSVNQLLVAALSVLAALFALWRRVPVGRVQVVGIVACLAAAFMGQWAFGQAVASMTGAKPVRPPFVAMRLIADGPGLTYLREHCATGKSIYCRVLDQQVTHSDVLLWSKDPQLSLFRGLTPDEQRISAAEQSRFVRSVVAEQPGPVISTAIANSLGQLTAFELSGFNYSSDNRTRFRDTMPRSVVRQIEQSRAYRNVMPTSLVVYLTIFVTLASIAFLIAFAFKPGAPGYRNLRAYGLCLVAGLAINAALCGALSGPKGRYEMRLIWVLPVAAMAIGAAVLRRSKIQASDSD